MTTPIGCLDGEQAIRDAVKGVMAPIGNMTDRHTAVLRTMERRLAFQQACGPHAIATLLAELDRLRSASRKEGWQPIETAPKDGTHILVSWPMRQMDDEYMPTGPITRRDTLVTWMNGDAWIEPDYLNASGAWYGDEDCYAADPDLWMPLPAAPHQSQEAQGDRHGE